LKKELKRQIKEDEFRSSLEMAFNWLWQHRDEAKFTAIVAALVMIGAFFLNSYQQRRAGEAARAFTEALSMFEAPLEAELPEGAPRPTGPVFAERQEKYTQAAAAFDGIERRHGSSAFGMRAAYYAALCRLEMGQLEEAEKGLEAVAARREPDRLEPALARLALVRIDRRAGRVEQAVEAYRQLLEDPESSLPYDHALSELAATLEEAGRRGEARASYLRLVDEFPGSVYAPEARRRAQYLETSAEG
jgi:tetratricopeptide (TPR) repeat protein